MTPPKKYVFVILENYKTHIGRNNSHIYTPLMELVRRLALHEAKEGNL